MGKLEGRSQLGRLGRRWDDKIKMKQDLVGKLEGRSQLGRPSRRWDDKIKMKQD